jgi:hypothetical protein
MTGTSRLRDPPAWGQRSWREPPPMILPAALEQDAKRSTCSFWRRSGPPTVMGTSHWPWPPQPLVQVNAEVEVVGATPGSVPHVPGATVTETPSAV